ncbi:MAG: bifunctional folylpolyglutamate synthase/dihydrofolate synthase [Flavobacteriaceae bacterium]|nr:bifunctional folylpolyglutamate synthase/dihydrofolate synthase [Flavobacteriaceae bacterium]
MKLNSKRKNQKSKTTGYQQTLNWMFSKLPMYQRQGKKALKKDLTNIRAFSKHLDSPEKKFKSIHVTGTNGKGSTSHMIASVLQEAGFKVGLYTSPHLKDFTERIRINGKTIKKKYVYNFIKKNKDFLEKQQLSFFEMTVGLAFEYFAKKEVDFAIIEVGLGGRLDSTNIITPIVSVITNIGLEHTQMLGNTLEKIAFEKAGIIKKNIPVIIGEKQKETFVVFQQKAKATNSEIFYASEEELPNYKTDLLGNYQLKNVKTAIKTCLVLNKLKYNIQTITIKNGLLNVVNNTNLQGRWQLLNKNPKVICDTAHNKEGLTYVLNQLNKEKYDNLHIVLGVLNDKDLSTILPLFPKKATYYFCKPNIPRGLDSQVLRKKALTYNLKGEEYITVNKAYKLALKNATNNDIVFIGGSTFVVAEII